VTAKQPKRRSRPGVDRVGRTPLHYAAASADAEAVGRLLVEGADPNARDDDGWTPLHFAAQANSPQATAALLAAGADPGLRDSHGNAPLFRAVFASRGDGSVIAALRAAGADSQAANDSGVTPVALARSIGNFDVAQFFADIDA